MIDKKYIPLCGVWQEDFNICVGILKRPYTKISKKMFETILKNKTDFILFNGEICTFGSADDGYAIMPLIIDKQKEKFTEIVNNDECGENIISTLKKNFIYQ